MAYRPSPKSRMRLISTLAGRLVNTRKKPRPVIVDATAAGSTVTVVASMLAGSASVPPAAAVLGATMTATASLSTAGTATGGATTSSGGVMSAAVSITAGAASADTAAASGKRAISNGYGWHVLSGAELDFRLDKLNNAGVEYVRTDFRWAEIQPTSNTYNWTNYDFLMNRVNARGMKMLAIVMDAPSWAGSSNHIHASPTNLTAWGDFCAALVSRYTALEAVEVWNEPNIFFWQPQPNVANYTAALISAYNAIKGVRSSIKVLAGSFSPAADNGYDIAPATFLNGIYSNGGKNYFDAISNHPYTFDSPSGPDGTEGWNPWYIMRTTLRSKMVAEGDSDKKIWVTEFGAPTWNGGVTEAQQADVHLKRAYERAREIETYVEYIFIHTLKDKLTNDQTDRENHFGLIRDDNTDKPGWTYFASLTDSVSTLSPRQTKLFTPPYPQGTQPAAGVVCTHTLTLDAPAVAGNDIIVFTGIEKMADTTFTPPAGYTEIQKHVTGPSISLALYHKKAVGGEQSITFTTTSTVGHHGATILAQEWTGLAASPIDKSAIAHTNGQNVFSFSVGPTATTAQTNEIALLFWTIDSVSVMTSDVTMTGGFVHQATYRSGYANTGAAGIAWGKKILSATEALSSTMSFSGTIADQTGAIIVSLKLA
jgi:hypothetical protein